MIFRGREVLNWSLNNYLGLANHPEVRKADAEAAAEFGMAYPMGARMMSGQTKWHEQLERELAAFVGKPDAFLLNYGYQGMISIIDSLLTRRDVVVLRLGGACLHHRRAAAAHGQALRISAQRHGSLPQAARPCDETGRGERRAACSSSPRACSA